MKQTRSTVNMIIIVQILLYILGSFSTVQGMCINNLRFDILHTCVIIIMIILIMLLRNNMDKTEFDPESINLEIY